MITGMEKWMTELLQKVCETLRVKRFLGQMIRFEISLENYSSPDSFLHLHEMGSCNLEPEPFQEAEGVQHPEGPILATQFGEDKDQKRRWIRLYIQLDEKYWAVHYGGEHYIEFDGANWSWNQTCGGYPADTYFVEHFGKIVKV